MTWHRVGDVEVWGPYRDESGRVTAVSARFNREIAERFGARLLTRREADMLWQAAGIRVPPHPRDVVRAQLTSLDDDLHRHPEWHGGDELVCVGKLWIADPSAAAGRATNYGWWVPSSEVRGGTWRGVRVYPSSVDAHVIQPPGHAHDETHVDYSQAGYVARDVRTVSEPPDTDPAPPPSMPSPAPLPPPVDRVRSRTLRLTVPRMHGPDVADAQRAIGATADGIYGPVTERNVRVWQAAQGLVPDGIWGRKSWRAAGYDVPEIDARNNDPRAPACVAALRDSNAAFPGRSRISDGIMGDAAHQARPSDHNLGNAVDITHDPARGCDCNVLAEQAITDPRVTYVIWNRRIYNRARAAEGWRAYRGSNGHTHHMHISVRVDARDDASPWPWSRL